MPVRPNWLDGVAAHVGKPDQLKCPRRERLVRTFVQVTHHIHLAFAPGARAMPPEFFEGHIGFGAVFPFNGEFVTDCL